MRGEVCCVHRDLAQGFAVRQYLDRARAAGMQGQGAAGRDVVDMGVAGLVRALLLGDGEALVGAVGGLQFDLLQARRDGHVPFRLDLVPAGEVLPHAAAADGFVQHERAVVAHVHVHQPALTEAPALRAVADGVEPLAVPLQEGSMVDEAASVGVVRDLLADVGAEDVRAQAVAAGGVAASPVHVPGVLVAEDLRLIGAQRAQELGRRAVGRVDGHLAGRAGDDVHHVPVQLHGPVVIRPV